MSKSKLKVLCVHGIGGHPIGGAWEEKWAAEIRRGLSLAGVTADDVEMNYCHYDDIFERFEVSFLDSLNAVKLLMESAGSQLFRSAGAPNSRGVLDGVAGGIDRKIRQTAGMVVKWVEDSSFRRLTRERLCRRIDACSPDVIVAHSLGTLVAYDTFIQPETAAKVAGKWFITAGSQIGSPFIVKNFGLGRIVSLPEARGWLHLYNEEDAAFAAPLNLHAANFLQVDTYFDEVGILDHSAEKYFGHKAADVHVWQPIGSAHLAPRTRSASAAQTNRAVGVFGGALPDWAAAPKKRALLIGINEYQKIGGLEGCVNDVFLMSSVLQECGFEADDIRIVLNDRATTSGIQERLDWLFDGVRGGEERVLFYSGHGAQMRNYGFADKADRDDEVLCPHDFDWTPEHSILDDDFRKLYSNLPYETDFIAIMDCCHSGGMTRGNSFKVRGVTPPDDIFHRSIRWNPDLEMWESRDREEERKAAKCRLGMASGLRISDKAGFKKRVAKSGHFGPYMPILMYASQEDEVAYEYRHGSVPYGAFTFCLAQNLRKARRSGKTVTFKDLGSLAAKDVADLGYSQHPVIDGPRVKIEAKVPMLGTTTRKRRKK